ncbi:hypothetical protein BDV98DRAFT_333297 [Pterulicium gracile]|uniref:Uncharacterized protein n=1 Tax=Pterulicium gracile TaxID=1884261 RepID=A0A5C3QTS9_9AGAR|nr:hypothetical protein BDV98DRAFT_333297 [Pterula gracilis]
MQISRGILALFAGAGLQIVAAAVLPQINTSSLPISESCITALTDIMASPEAECLNLSALLSFIVFPENGVEDILNTWLTGMCSVGSCSDAALDTLIGGIVNQCSGDLAAFGVSSDVTEKVVDIVKKAYPTAREIVCLKETTSGNFCAIEEVKRAERAIRSADIDIDNIDIDLANVTMITAWNDLQSTFMSTIEGVTCTSCIKEAYNIANEGFPDLVPHSDVVFDAVCGPEFLDGAKPRDVVRTAPSSVFIVADEGAAVSNLKTAAGRYLVLAPALLWMLA